MSQSHSILSSLILLVAIIFCIPHAIAAPWTTDGHAQLSTVTPRHPTQEPSGIRYRNVIPQLTWLCDTAIEKIFGLPPKVAKRPGVPGNVARPTNAQLPATLLAKYGGDVVLRFNLSTPAEEQALAEAADTLFLDVWEFTSNWADIRLREDDVPSLLGLLPKSLQTAYSHLMPDLAKSIYQSYPSMAYADAAFSSKHVERAFTPALRTSKVEGADNIFFQNYQPLSVIIPWMRLMSSMFSTHVRMINIGVSYEGRDIPALRIGVSPNLPSETTKPRKTIILSGGFHAREWISVSSVTYAAWSLITSYGKSPAITKLLQEFDFVLIPSINVDGYVYTWENDRLWRKNRQQTNLRFCRGLDLDRGFGFEWGSSTQINPCSESYPGDAPFQAVESHRFAEWAKNETENNNVHFVGFLDLHSYSQQVLYPYSYSCLADPPSLENLEELGIGLAKAIRISSGEQYTVASACEGAISSKIPGHSSTSRMEMGGGSAIDWFYHELGVRYSYQIKLRDTGSYGFLLPKENIVPTGDEVFNVIKYFGDFLLGDKGIEKAKSSNEDSITEPVKLESPLGVKEEESVIPNELEDEYEDINWELKRRRRG
ncbi:93a645ae-b24f-4fae-9597-cf7d4a49905f [Sclerotinia trifoliorum]|uniref:Inactive metallocarboxypeptidase ECM14 n=1 Tax=Sclerotinia trifoliorum TaxID=28548 RepID=A0A8H2VN56_9HELO|nr:93a645ae-b24f-4fae-9597-cf7d4a49905f [Sclerotinia trifoliorum]